MLVAIVCLAALVIVWITHWVYTWSNPKCNGKLPPSSMGFPIIGETLEFFAPHPFYDIPPFIRKRITRYGPLFRTSLLGKKVVISTDPEINNYIIQQEGKSVLLWYTESFANFVREESIVSNNGMIHKYLKNLSRHLVGPENLKANVVHEVDQVIRGHLHSWASQATVDLKEVASNMIFSIAAKQLISYDESNSPAMIKLSENFKAFKGGLFTFPLDIPGTSYHARLQGIKNMKKIIKYTLEERKASKTPRGDFLDYLLVEVERKESFLHETTAIDMVVALLFATHETTPSLMTLGTLFISNHPHVLAELTKEHEAILRSRDNEESKITWEEYKSLTFTHMVINEIVRLANLIPGFFRKVVKDIELKGKFNKPANMKFWLTCLNKTYHVLCINEKWGHGYTIPTGWTVIIVPSILHLNPEVYADPHTFNPWRWEGKELHAGSKTFMGFGGGVRLCVGADFAKLQMAIFIHYLVTQYRWKVIGGGEVIRNPGLVFPNGLQIEISEKDKY